MPRKLKKYGNTETKAVVEEEWYDDRGQDANMLQVEPNNSLAITAEKWWEDNHLSHAYTDEGWKVGALDDTWYTDEINHMTRSGRYVKRATLD